VKSGNFRFIDDNIRLFCKMQVLKTANNIYSCISGKRKGTEEQRKEQKKKEEKG